MLAPREVVGRLNDRCVTCSVGRACSVDGSCPPVPVTVTSDKVLSGSAGGRVWAWPPVENHERTLALLPTGEQDPKWGCGGTREGRQ